MHDRTAPTNCARDIFITPSCTAGQTNFAPSRRLWIRTMPVRSQIRIFSRSRALGAEHEGRPAERIAADHLLHGQGEPVDALAEVDRTGRDVDPQLPMRRDHAEAARTARITRVSWASSTSAATRTVTPATTSSIRSGDFCAVRVFRVDTTAGGSTTSAANAGSPVASAGAPPACPRPASSASHRPASVSRRAAARRRRPSPPAPGSPPRSAPARPRSEDAGPCGPRSPPSGPHSQPSSRPNSRPF